MEIKRVNIQTIKGGKYTQHLTSERMERVRLAYELMKSENPYIVDTFEVDKGHANGSELHIVFSNATIVIFNAKSLNFVTILFAREGQIRRYGISENSEIFEYCKRNVNKGYNRI